MNTKLRKTLHNLNALTELSGEIASTKSFDEVVRASLHTLLGTLAIPRGAIARFSDRPRRLKVVAARGVREAAGLKITLGPDEVEKLIARTRPLDLAAERNGLAQFVLRNREFLKRLRARAAVPMVVRGELVGMIFLSEKFNGEPFSDEDWDMLKALARHIGLAFHNHRLMVSLRRRAEENRRLYRDMRQMYLETVRAFGAAIDLKDTYTKGHSDRVARFSEAIAREMGIQGEDLERLSVAAYLHDIGKIVVDRSIINNPRPLTDREFRELNRHATTGYEILSHISHSWQEIAAIAKWHHEKVDGTGYPDGLRGEQIPLASKIVTLADAFDAMMSDRPYRARLPLLRALADLRANTGKQFAAEVVAAFCRLLLKEIQGRTRERVFVSFIGNRFDRPAVEALLNEMVAEFDTGPHIQ